MRQFDRSTVVDEELHDLKLRFELLEGDRKAYYETSQWAIRQNKEEVSQLRMRNKELSDAIAKLKKTEADVQSNRASMSELEKFDQKICEMHKKFDELQAEARAKEEKLRGMHDQLADLRREAEIVKSNLQDSPQAKEIRMLENRLDKAMIKYNEAQAVRKTYEQIVKRLQEERLTFDNQLANFEKSLKAKKQDASELEMMSRDANHAKEVAKAELARLEQQINEERKQREKDLQTRKELVKQKLEISDKIDWKKLQLEDQTGDMAMTAEANKEHYDEAREKKIVEYEENMRLIKEATGVSDINEVIAKFQSQGDTHQHLSQLQKANEARNEELKRKKKEILAEYEDLKYSGEAKLAHARRMIEEMEQHLAEAEVKTAETKVKYERTAKLMTNAKAGINHLSDKLDGIHLPDTPSLKMSDETVVQILEICIRKLEQLATNVQGKEVPEPVAPQPVAPATAGETTSIFQISPSQLPVYNTRVKLRPVEFEESSGEDEEEDDDYGEVPDRETIKKHTAQMLNAKLKTKQAKKGKKKRAAKDED
ncbi:uncharacterized protein SPPG_02080 [Spizellomyces punctatus DAOM BR117]|uniref:ODAD1 central coiled coil region domain-containing protein n=1 Tax=Spizellomyces punctatus (strain DAOM BR117) TaxID=645134 RepID=A0A0L0HQC2_SPIPD|nr:uncharacterized protein SPPG_02080 [Spizellomyces punctatus DAOM BR117]KND03009.1 hypothetical protein SPPG_02080 [Spizellomyces punctatus DAOM BR117]|eukprot:XP_016611048.1 hypothetical protein SPPG_02080 [Spizellomyces punctatus DAOM BR117]